MSRICLGVRNCPLRPAVESLPSMYSYRSPCISRSAISCSYSSSSPVTTFSSTCGVGMRNTASFMKWAKAACAVPSSTSGSGTNVPFSSSKSGSLPPLMPLKEGKTRWDMTSNIYWASLFLNLLQRMDWPAGVCGKIFSTFMPRASYLSFSSSLTSSARTNMR